MAKETFYEALFSKRYNKDEFGRLVFILEKGGPQYKVIPGEEYSSLKDSIKNDDYQVRMIFPGNHEITDLVRKRELLEQFFHNGRKI
jgi:hypothetical protein